MEIIVICDLCGGPCKDPKGHTGIDWNAPPTEHERAVRDILEKGHQLEIVQTERKQKEDDGFRAWAQGRWVAP